VIKAAERSGSLITARLGCELGREIFAIPGSIHHPLSRGRHQLLQQGAKLTQSPRDILEELPKWPKTPFKDPLTLVFDTKELLNRLQINQKRGFLDF